MKLWEVEEIGEEEQVLIERSRVQQLVLISIIVIIYQSWGPHLDGYKCGGEF